MQTSVRIALNREKNMVRVTLWVADDSIQEEKRKRE